MLTGRYRKGQPLPDSLRVKSFLEQMKDARNLDAVERLDDAGNPAAPPAC